MSSLHFTRILGSISNCCEYIHISIPMITQEQKVNGIENCIFKKKAAVTRLDEISNILVAYFNEFKKLKIKSFLK